MVRVRLRSGGAKYPGRESASTQRPSILTSRSGKDFLRPTIRSSSSLPDSARTATTRKQSKKANATSRQLSRSLDEDKDPGEIPVYFSSLARIRVHQPTTDMKL